MYIHEYPQALIVDWISGKIYAKINNFGKKSKEFKWNKWKRIADEAEK